MFRVRKPRMMADGSPASTAASTTEPQQDTTAAGPDSIKNGAIQYVDADGNKSPVYPTYQKDTARQGSGKAPTTTTQPRQEMMRQATVYTKKLPVQVLNRTMQRIY